MKYRAGFVGLIGLPNSGKSTLTNELVGEKVSIVSPKAQSTRQSVKGIVQGDEFQMILVDAPGYVQNERGLNSYLKSEFAEVISESDALLLVLARGVGGLEEHQEIVEKIRESRRPWMILRTKMDLPPRDSEFEAWAEELCKDVPSLSMNLLKSSPAQWEELKNQLSELLPLGEGPLYDSELYTTQNVRDMVSELIREKAFLYLHQEVPYSLAVKILKYDENEGPILKVYAELVVAKDGHKAMVIGQSAGTIKKIGTEARLAIEKLVERKVFLDLHVTVKKNWLKNKSLMKELGYVGKS